MNKELRESVIQVKKFAQGLFAGISADLKIDESICANILVLAEVVKKYDTIIPAGIYGEYKDFFAQFSHFCQLCKEYNFLVENIDTFAESLGLFIECLEQLERQLVYQIPKCTCCGRRIRSNQEELTCNWCGAEESARLIISFLKTAELPYSKKGTKVLQIAPIPSVERWITDNCPGVTYHSANLNVESEYDFWICSDIWEYIQDDRNAMEELKRILKPDGVGVFALPVSFDKRLELVQEIEHHGLFVHMLDEEMLGESALLGPNELYLLSKTEADTIKLLQRLLQKTALGETEQPLVTVVMSAYNHEKYVGAAIESVINQTYKNIEFIVGDDASTDRTVSVMKQYSSYYASEYYSEKNTGGLGGMLLEKATGKYVAKMNSDDIWELDKIEKQVKFMERNPEYAACFTWCTYTDENLNEIPADIFIQKNRSSYEWMYHFYKHLNCLCHPSILILREVYQEITRKNGLAYRQLPDFSMWIRLIQQNNIYIMQEALVKMRRHDSGKTRNASAGTEENMCRYKNENMYLWYSYIKNMEEDFFKKAFANELVRKEAEGREEIICEKFFLLMNDESKYMKLAAMFLYFEINLDEKVRACFENKYNYFRKDFYELSAAAGMPAMENIMDKLFQVNERLQQMLEQK